MKHEISTKGLPPNRKQAKITETPYYFTNKPCKHNHISPRLTSTGHCIECSRVRWSDSTNTKIFYYTREYYRNHPNKRLVQAAKVRAKRKGIEFNLTFDDIIIPDKCPVLGIELTSHVNKRLQDNSATIDRIDSTKGYTTDNVIVVSWRANRLKNDASIDEMEKIMLFYKQLQLNKCDNK